jgi:hypothetical protein
MKDCSRHLPGHTCFEIGDIEIQSSSEFLHVNILHKLVIFFLRIKKIFFHHRRPVAVEELEPEAFQIIAPMEFVVNAAIFLGMQSINN